MVQHLEILSTKDLTVFDNLHKTHFNNEYPPINQNNVTAARNVYLNNKPVASGVVKVLTEAIIVTDQNAHFTIRMKAIDLMIKEMFRWCRRYHVEQMHAFVKEDFAEYLMKKYDFERTKDVSLVLNLED